MKMALTGDVKARNLSLIVIAVLTAVTIYGAVAATPQYRPDILITEVLSSNTGVLYDEDGSSPDFIELYNAGEDTQNLQGWFLSDNSNRPMKWEIPAVILRPGEYTVFYASGKDKRQSDGIWHTNFKISSDGTEQIVLTMPDGTVHRTFGPYESTENVSYGLCEDFTSAVYMPIPTPGRANLTPFYNDLQSVILQRRRLVITEYMTSNDSFFPDEDGLFFNWAEIYNPGNESIDLTGWYLSDNPNKPKKWRFPDSTVIGAGEYLTLQCSGLDLPGHVPFRLSENDGSLVLSDYNGLLIDQIDLFKTPMYASYGRKEGIFGQAWQEGFFAVPTPNAQNAGEPVPTVEELTWDKPPLLIMEYMSNNDIIPDEDGQFSDWVELYNYGSRTIDLSDIYLSDRERNRDKWSFDEGTQLNPGQRAVVWLSRKESPLHAGFAISQEDDGLFLSDKYGRTIDYAVIVRLPGNVSAGRDENDFNRWLFFPRPTPNAPNDTTGFTELAQMEAALLEEMHASGVYPDDTTPLAGFTMGVQTDTDDLIVQAGQQVSLRTDEPGGKIFYTLDGSVPTEKSPEYAKPLRIIDNTVLRACVISGNKPPSKILSRTYVIDTNHDIPVVALSTDPDGMFSHETGIYADGPGFSRSITDEINDENTEYTQYNEYNDFGPPYYGANFHKDWEREAHFAFYVDGVLHVETDAGIKIHGNWSRMNPQKSMAVFFRNMYGVSQLAYPFIPGIPRTVYDALILRTSGQDWNASKLRDAFIHKSVADVTNISAMGTQPVAVYINGEYWGLYNLREKLNEDYFKINEDIPDDEIDIIERNHNVEAGSIDEYMAMVNRLAAMRMNTDEAYAYIDTNIDIDNWIDYWITVTFFGNTDTSNIKFYKQQGEGHKWRWILFDQDHALKSNSFDPFDNMLAPEGHGQQHGHFISTVIAQAMMSNDKIRARFLERYEELLDTVLSADRLLRILDDYARQIEKEMPRQIARWNQPPSMQQWRSEVEAIRTFITGREDVIKKFLESAFTYE